MLKFFDALMSMGKTNNAFPSTPGTEAEILAIMDHYDVSRAMVYHTVTRDAAPDEGNEELLTLTSPRLSMLWGLETAYLGRVSL